MGNKHRKTSPGISKKIVTTMAPSSHTFGKDEDSSEKSVTPSTELTKQESTKAKTRSLFTASPSSEFTNNIVDEGDIARRSNASEGNDKTDDGVRRTSPKDDKALPTTSDNIDKYKIMPQNKREVKKDHVAFGIVHAKKALGYDSGATKRAPKVRYSNPEVTHQSEDVKVKGTGNGNSNVQQHDTQNVSRREPQKHVSQQSLGEAQFPKESMKYDSSGDESVDCLISEWSEWSLCSKTCGFGSQERSREVTQLPANGGAVCPPLTQKAMCGSMRTCKWSHFSVMKRKMGSLFRGPRGRRHRRRRKLS